MPNFGLIICSMVLLIPVSLGALFELGEMIYCTTGRNALTEVDCYGCYCGPGGHGTPIDSVDLCCKQHDECYGEATVNHNCSYGDLETYNVPYAWHCDTTDPDNPCVHCDDKLWLSSLSCSRAVCHCDRGLAECLAKATFNPEKPAPPLKQCPDRWCWTV